MCNIKSVTKSNRLLRVTYEWSYRTVKRSSIEINFTKNKRHDSKKETLILNNQQGVP